jgi:hypothetical protein
MEKFVIEKAPKIPRVDFDPVSGKLLLEGRSNPENARELFTPMIAWMDDYIRQPAEVTELTINLELFNTSTSKYIMELMRKIRWLADNDRKFRVVWKYEDDDEEMLDTAEAYEMMTGLRFEKVPYPEPKSKKEK